VPREVRVYLAVMHFFVGGRETEVAAVGGRGEA
jgi:hypothetical protein